MREGQLDEDGLVALWERCGTGIARPDVSDAETDPLLMAWCGLVQEHMPGGESDCFFTGTYSDGYGYPHGLMLARNIVADFRRFLGSVELADRDWVCCVEKHKSYRDILHLHALVAEVGGRQHRRDLEHAWMLERGFAKAKPLLDRGVAYCTKYALKSHEAAMFDWSWAS